MSRRVAARGRRAALGALLCAGLAGAACQGPAQSASVEGAPPRGAPVAVPIAPAASTGGEVKAHGAWTPAERSAALAKLEAHLKKIASIPVR